MMGFLSFRGTDLLARNLKSRPWDQTGRQQKSGAIQIHKHDFFMNVVFLCYYRREQLTAVQKGLFDKPGSSFETSLAEFCVSLCVWCKRKASTLQERAAGSSALDSIETGGRGIRSGLLAVV